jgi:hypothetical protein
MLIIAAIPFLGVAIITPFMVPIPYIPFWSVAKGTSFQTTLTTHLLAVVTKTPFCITRPIHFSVAVIKTS